MKKILLSLIAAIVATAVYAVPAIPTPLTFKQSDGSSITVRLVGDERFSTYLTTDGLALERAVDGDFYYRTATAVSKVRAHNVNARTQAELNYIQANSQQMQLVNLVPANMGGNNTARKAPSIKASSDVPQTGSPRIPIVLVQYSDFKMRSSNPVSTFNSQFNTKAKSCLQYFSDQSFGQFTPKFDILGPVTLSNTRAYYGARTSSGDNDAKPGSMVGEAVKQLTSVDWSLYDNDKNGSVDVVIILYAGPGEAQGADSNAIWPHQWYLSSAYYYGRSDYNAFYQNGVRIDKYACFCETSGSSDSRTTVDGIGTFCHEFSHCLGLPDFYETTYANGNFGMGNWSVMCSGSYLGNSATPAGYTAYEKEFMGWMSIPTAEANTYYTLNPISNSNSNAVRIYNSQSSDEYYILENNPKTGWYAYQASSGLMVNHVTYSSSAWNNNTVNNSNPQRMTIIPADNSLGTRYSSSESGDLYPYNGNNKLTDSSAPAAELNVGTRKLMGKPITDITKNSDGTVSFWFMKNFEKVVPTIQTVVPSDITISSFVAKWNTDENMRSFIFNVTGPDGYDKSFDNLTENTITVEDLKPGTTYTHVRLRPSTPTTQRENGRSLSM
ncbi:MAG: M6 family metalloprotease domain-containing protein [Bacteroidales bacterium]|nr:M6 family metalloprotease domain-containing protein [Candidatus Sodaliphilus fimicaballi]